MPKKKSKAKVFRGNVPDNGKHVDQLGDWCIYERNILEERWVNVKLISLAPRTRKANFHMGWDRKLGRLTRTRDGRTFEREEYDELRAWLVGSMAKHYPPL